MRVIAGTLKGHPLVAPLGQETRPTTDRVREALFSILGSVAQSRVLDLFAGTGALGIEALSRGAAHALFVEVSPKALVCLRKNIDHGKLEDRTQVIPQRAELSVSRIVEAGPFDLVFCDPPWSKIEGALALLARLAPYPWLTEDARIVVEHPTRQALPATVPAVFSLLVERHWGDTAIAVFGLIQPPSADEP